MAEKMLTYKNRFTSEEEAVTLPSRGRLHYAALLDTTHALNRILDYYELLQFILEKILDVSGADGASVLITDEDTFPFIGGRDSRRGILLEDPAPVSGPLAARIRAEKDVICVREVAQDADLQHDPILAAQYIHALVVLPMFRGDTLLGVVYLYSHITMPWVEDFDLSILRGMASQIAMATENAINLAEIDRLNNAVENEVKTRTEQLMEANQWLASNLEQAEKKIAQETEAEQKRSHFYSALAHELRSPMQLLLGHSTMMLADGEEHLSEEQRKSLHVLMKTSEHVRDLVTKVMDATKLEEGEMTISPAPFDIRPLIDDVAEMARGLLGGKPVQIVKYYNAEHFPLVVADAMRIRQVMLNLIANACRYTDKGKITISAMEHDAYVVLSVVDTGMGIPNEKLQSIFEPFKQADSLRAHQGAGLGLAISKQIVELHGGRMIVKSTLGTGSIFAFNLPIAL